MASGTPARRPRVRLSAEARELQLLDVAEQLFTDHGYEGVSVEDVARAAGVTRPVVYQRYGSKEELFLACVRRARAGFERDLAAAVARAPGDLRARLEAGGAVFFDLITRSPRRWSLLFSTTAGLESGLAEQLQQLRTTTVERIADVARPFAPGVPAEALLALAHALSGIGEQLGRWSLASPAVPTERLLGYFRTLALGAGVAVLGEYAGAGGGTDTGAAQPSR